jgi:nucleotide-binding universal stress UspA family protein
MKRLIVLIDFSDYSEVLIDLAFKWQGQYGFGLVFVHQVPGLIPALADNKSRHQILEYEKKQAGKKLEEILSKNHATQSTAQIEVTEKQLVQHLKSLLSPDDMLMVGLKGTGFLKKILIGSTVTDIIDQLNQITVAIPAKLNPHSVPEQLTVGLSYRYPLNYQAFLKLLEIFSYATKRVELVTVLTPNEDRWESEKYLKGLKIKLEEKVSVDIKMFEGTDTFGEIKKYIHQKDNGMFVVQKGSRTMNDKLFRKFLINDLVYDGALPLIVLPL